MPRKCCIHGCKSNWTRNDYTPVFLIPKDINRQQKWLSQIQQEDLKLSQNTAVCIKHFSDAFLIKKYRHIGGIRTHLGKNSYFHLTKSAYPSIFPMRPNYHALKPKPLVECNKAEGNEVREDTMKRIRVLCGICRGTKYYSINRGITKVSSIIACENCRHFYQKLKRNPFSLDCISPIKGSCYKDCSFMKTRCKGCWAMQLLDSCPHPNSFYTFLSGWISEDCRKQMRGVSLRAEEIEEDAHGKVSIEVYEQEEWKEMPFSEEELAQLPVTHEDEVTETPPPPVPTSRRTTSRTTSQEEEEVELEEERQGRSRASSIANSKGGEDPLSSLNVADLALETEEEMIDLEEEEAMVDDPDPPATTARSAKMSERIKRKRKKVEYFTKPFTGRKTKGPIYGSDGKINKTGMDLCDCLQPECVGCHFPCPKCRSPKCGNECRVNRRWYYEKVEVEGTKMFWVNRFVPKV